MVSTEDVLSKQPWGETYWEHRMGFNYGYAGKIPRRWDVPIHAQFNLCTDKKQSYWRRGDIVRFHIGYHNMWQNKDWQEWFMPQDKYLEYLHRNKPRNRKVPMYARLEYGMVVSRYRWAKDKQYKVFYDYGTIILMLTGPKAGHMRRYYIKSPFDNISRFPYDHVTPFYAKQGCELPEVGRLQEAMHYAKGDKDQFVLNMIESYNNPNYAEERECEYQSHMDSEKTTGTTNLPFQGTFS